MCRKLTITLSHEVYEGLHRTVGRDRISTFIEDLLRPHVGFPADHIASSVEMEDGYRAMAADRGREQEAAERVESLAGETLK